jgi:hypothetical protein
MSDRLDISRGAAEHAASIDHLCGAGAMSKLAVLAKPDPRAATRPPPAVVAGLHRA